MIYWTLSGADPEGGHRGQMTPPSGWGLHKHCWHLIMILIIILIIIEALIHIIIAWTNN